MHGTDVENWRHNLRQLHGFDLHEEQIQAIKTLAIDREDLILIARTGWGKSIIFQSLPAIRQGIVLMIMPLNLLEEEQVYSFVASELLQIRLICMRQAELIAKIPKCKPCVLNGQSNTESLRQRIQNGEYTHG
jgi:superfamily II DNA helicase RecQ